MTAAPDTDPTLDAALHYATLGLRVLPIKPGHKYPAGVGRWQDAATTDPTVITAWWTGLYRGHGIGIATGPGSGVWVLDVDVTDGKTGDDTLHDLEQAYGPLPDTVEATTGSGGRHLFYAWDPDHPVRNDQSGRLGHALDVRGDGGQVLVEPTIHPNGQPYTWVDGHAPGDIAFADAPGWIYALLERDPRPTPPPAPPTPTPSTPAGDRPGDIWAATTTWDQLLTADGWTHAGTGPDGETRWTRPGKDPRDGISATTGYKGSDVLKVFTSSVPTLEPDATYTKLGYLAATRHGGDHSAAASALRAAGHHTPVADVDAWLNTLATTAADPDTESSMDPATHGWELADVASTLTADYTAPIPTILTRNDGAGLLYTGRINALLGESGSGKSWLAFIACAQQVTAGHHVLVIDLEDHLASVTARMRALGVNDQDLAERFHYIAPTLAWNPTAATHLASTIEHLNITLVVIDSTGEAMASDGAKPNDDDDTARWFRRVPRYLASLGPAVVLIDHVPKASDAPKGYAIGSQRKRAAIDGASYRVEAVIAPAKGKEGRVKLTVAKDRNGHYQQGAKVAEVIIIANDTGTQVTADLEPAEGNMRPTVLMERVAEWLADQTEPKSKRAISAGVTGNEGYKRIAVDFLVKEGYVRTVAGLKGDLYELIEPFRQDPATRWVDDLTTKPVDNPDEEDAPRPPRPHRDHTATNDEIVAVGDRDHRDHGASVEPMVAGRGHRPPHGRGQPVDNPDDGADDLWLFT